MDVLILCPLCNELLEEPVTLPCSHELCLDCFKQSIDAGNFHCPLCRHRISNWARRMVNNPVDKKRKEQLHHLYSQIGRIEDLRLVASLQEPASAREEREGEREENKDLVQFYEEKRQREMSDEHEAARLQEEERLSVLEVQKQVEEDEKLARKMSEEFESENITRTPVSQRSEAVRNSASRNTSSLGKRKKDMKSKENEKPSLTLHDFWCTKS